MDEPFFRMSIEKLPEVKRDIMRKRSLIEVRPNSEWPSNYQRRVEAHNTEVLALLNDDSPWKEAGDALSKATKNPKEIDERACKDGLEEIRRLTAEFDDLRMSKGVFLPYATDGPPLKNRDIAARIQSAIQKDITNQLEQIASVDDFRRELDDETKRNLEDARAKFEAETNNLYEAGCSGSQGCEAINKYLTQANEIGEKMVQNQFVRPIQ